MPSSSFHGADRENNKALEIPERSEGLPSCRCSLTTVHSYRRTHFRNALSHTARVSPHSACSLVALTVERVRETKRQNYPHSVPNSSSKYSFAAISAHSLSGHSFRTICDPFKMIIHSLWYPEWNPAFPRLHVVVHVCSSHETTLLFSSLGRAPRCMLFYVGTSFF